MTVTMFTSPEVLFPLVEQDTLVLVVCLTSLYDEALTKPVSTIWATGEPAGTVVIST
ncbi:hypothetical protein [Gordonia iterans]